MRHRWYVSEGFSQALFGIWILGWMPPFTAIWAIGAPDGMNSKHNYLPALVFLAAWFGVVIVPALLFGAWALVRFLWAERPRRVVEPVREDLREVSR